jgi:outer membrane protein assembly factor BamB
MITRRVLFCCAFVLSVGQFSCAGRPETGADGPSTEADDTNGLGNDESSGIEWAAQSPKAATSDWPQWRGPNRDGKSLETGLLKSWPKGGPKLLWTFRDSGKGYSGPAVIGNRLFLLGSSADGSNEIALAIDVLTGERIWQTEISRLYTNPYGDGPRSTPTLDNGRVYVLTADGTLACLDAESGEKVWTKHLVRDFRGAVPGWGYSESPLVDGDRLVVTPGGKNCIVALDKNSGATLMTSRGLADPAQYASLIKTFIERVPIYCTMTRQGLVGILAQSGELAFRHEATANGTAVIPTPIAFRNYVFSTSGYGAGCGLVKLSVTGSTVEADEVYANKNMVNHHGGVVLVDRHLYGFSDGKGWICQELTTGKLLWSERRALAKGSITFADDRIYCYSENDGTIVLAVPSPAGWKETGRFTIPEKTNVPRNRGRIWTHPVVAGGKLFLRDQDLLFCYDVKGRQGKRTR